MIYLRIHCVEINITKFSENEGLRFVVLKLQGYIHLQVHLKFISLRFQNIFQAKLSTFLVVYFFIWVFFHEHL